jgi:recombination protein RecA
MIDGKKSVVRKRIAIETPDLKSQGNYFTSEKSDLSFSSSGCTVLDCALGGGWCLGRIGNIIGDRSTAKTGLAVEALINFLQTYPKSRVGYRETEAAFDKKYAEAMGLPISKIDFGPHEPLNTVEDFARDFDKFLDERIKSKEAGIYILDSLDALSDEAEMERDIGKGTYAMEKAKMLSTFFRKSARKQEQAKVLLLIVSQVRENIGVTFGDKFKRSGGKALDFYASQVILLAHIETMKRTINKLTRPVGINIKAKVRKNKVGLPFREAEFIYEFGYGIKDVGASIAWLQTIDSLKDADIEDVKTYLKELETLSAAEYREECLRLSGVVKKKWAEIETLFIPQRMKYV